ncbi:hypothetical protein [Pendulispora albinea]|uniref:Zinicin-like metallopeptidase n=1 Tax=Pendulispora albinea TaxID=2741071 RepID=A0ABZ2LY43_9BACT
MTTRTIRVELPSHRTVTLRAEREILPRTADLPFTGARKLFASGDVVILDKELAVDVDSLALGDFHALRAIAVRLGWLHEKTIEIQCINCEHTLIVAPCESFALGPFEEGALSDAELDVTLPVGTPHPVPSLFSTRASAEAASTITFRALTLGEARPLHAALARSQVRVTKALVRAMGIEAIGRERSPERIADLLRDCSDRAFHAITRLFLMTHYPPRLFAMARCPECGARNDVDAPYEREFGFEDEGPESGSDARSNEKESFVSFDDFALRAEALYAELVPEEARRELTFLVEGGTPACDDGGDPLLGSYVPPHPGDDMNPSRLGEITVFYRTFRATWESDEGFDWTGELGETIEHEFEHHIGFLRGDDPKDDEERDQIDAEAVRIHGRRTLMRRDVAAFGYDVWDFWRRTWFFWILALIAAAALTWSRN